MACEPREVEPAGWGLGGPRDHCRGDQRNRAITEQTPKTNPFWDYSQNKIACERVLDAASEDSALPTTIVRPSLTYGPSQIPVIIGRWEKPFTIVDRIQPGAKIIVPGDGTAIWTLTHNSDFAKGLIGLFGLDAAIGEDSHITSDDALSSNRMGRQGAQFRRRGVGLEPVKVLNSPLATHIRYRRTG